MTNDNDFQILRIEDSPFLKKTHHGKYVRGKPKVKESLRIPESAYKDIMKYFQANDLTFTDGINGLIADKLKMVNTFRSRKVFSNFEFIMLIPETDGNSEDLEEMTEKARIIALYNTETAFKKHYNYEYGFRKGFNYQYEMRPFGQSFFREEMEMFNMMESSPCPRVRPEDLRDWDSFYDRLDELYGLRGTSWYFVRCPLNNFLDVNRDGQLQSGRYGGDHEGLYAFHDLDKSLYCRINWSYSLENESIAFEIEFIMMSEFLDILYKSDFKPLRESIADIKSSEYNRQWFEALIDGQRRWLALLENTYDDKWNSDE